MSKIYISDEAIQKYLKEGADVQTLNIIKKFKANRRGFVDRKITRHKHSSAQKIQKEGSPTITTLSKDAIEAIKLFNLKASVLKKEARKLSRSDRKNKKKKRTSIGVVMISGCLEW